MGERHPNRETMRFERLQAPWLVAVALVSCLTLFAGPTVGAEEAEGVRGSEAPCPLTITPAARAVPSGGGTYSLTIDTGAACTWVATTSSTWIALPELPMGTGDGTVTYTVSGNWTGQSRTGTVEVMAVTPGAMPAMKAHKATQATKTATGKPVFSPRGGLYHTPQAVTIASTTPGATIRYTANGTTPTRLRGRKIANGGSVLVKAGATLKAIAYKRGLADSRVASAVYAIEPYVLTAEAGPDREAVQGLVVVLDGTLSVGPGDGVVSWTWAQSGGPGVTLTDASPGTAMFTAPGVGPEGTDLFFTLTVADSTGATDADEVTVHVVQAEQPPAPTSEDLIDAAVERGAITEEEGLSYKVFSVFGDSRLPAEFRGTESDAGTRVMAGLRARFASLSDEAKAVLRPFLLQPHERGSWNGLATVREPAQRALADPVWKNIGTKNGYVKIWYPSDLPGGEDKAEGVRAAIDGRIWSKLETLMNTRPLEDLAYPKSGGDRRLDISLVSDLDARGVTIPYNGCEKTPAYIQVLGTRPLGGENTIGIVQTVTHEMFHAWQFRYPLKDDCSTYDWVCEATCKWMEDYVYPNANSENSYAPPFLDTPHLSFDDRTNDRDYGAYVFYSYLTSAGKAPESMIRKLWENNGSMDTLKAVDESTGSGGPDTPHSQVSLFLRHWGDSLVANWNRGPGGYFRKKDKLEAQAKAAPNTPTNVTLSGQPDRVYFLDNLDQSGSIAIPYLSGRYYHFLFAEDEVATVLFYDGLRQSLDLAPGEYNTIIYHPTPLLPNPLDPLADPAEGATWKLIAKIGGVWKEWVPYQGATTGMVSFCRDAKDERLEELVVVLANSSEKKDKTITPQGTAPLLLASNLACYGWDGSVTASFTSANGRSEQTQAALQFRRIQDAYPGTYPPGTVPPGNFVVKTGGFTTTISGAGGGCTYDGGDSWAWDSAGGPSPEAPNAGIETIPGGRDGDLYRKFNGWGGSGGHAVSYVQACPPDAPGIIITHPRWWDPVVASGGVNAWPAVSSDGGFLGGSVTKDGTTFIWSLGRARQE